MTLAQYREGFSDYHQGRLSALHILSSPVLPKYEVDIKEEDRQKLQDLITSASKKQQAPVVFFGQSDTDKGNLLSRLSRQLQLAVCWIDCQRLVSKYIGETEKNLARIVADAQSSQWILFFDEADALFGKRTEVKDSHNKFAGTELKLILDRLLDYKGLSIFSLHQQSILDKVKNRLSCIIHCR
jgi:SpoVK/Ycf46/Vps4 family AAA+-type ATPase